MSDFNIQIAVDSRKAQTGVTGAQAAQTARPDEGIKTMNINQGSFLSALGIRENDLAVLPIEIQMEFDRLGDMAERRDREKQDHCYRIAGPFRRSRPCKRRF